MPLSIDLAGRTGFSARSGRGRGLLLSIMERMPLAFRRVLVPAAISALVRHRLQPHWQRELASCDTAVIGGGALLADADQNFPIKISRVLDLCAERQIPVAISHVGVTRHWSEAGRTRFMAALARVRLAWLGVRDHNSVRHFVDEFGTRMGTPELTLDPGLLCRETYGAPEAPAPAPDAPAPKKLGLCLTHPLVLRLHGEGRVDDQFFRDWLVAVVERACDRGFEVSLFTNGSPEDEDFADEIAQLIGPRPEVQRQPRFITPGELARFIATLDCLVAHRLHACIAAYSYRVPAIGFSWDRKLDSFFELMNRGDYVVDLRSTSPGSLLTLIDKALDNPIDEAEHKAIIDECRHGIERLAARLVEAREAK